MIRLPEVPAAQRPMLRFLLVLTVASLAGLQGWRTLFNNFAVEVAGMGGDQVGVIQAVREIPGFLALLAVWVMLWIAEYRLSALSILVLGLGTAATGLFPTYLGLACTTLAMSFGFHYYETTNQSLTLQYFDQGTAPLVFGALRSAGAATNVAVGVLIFGLSAVLDYRQMFLLIGLVIAGVGVWGLLQNPVDRTLAPQHKHMVLRRRYGLFYFLTFMAGARRQVFIAFSVFLLVKVFAFSVREVTVLFVVNNVIGYVAGPLLGRAIVRFGERRVLSLEYGGLILVFLGYAWTQSRWVAAGHYVLDHLLFSFSMAVKTYFQKVADPADLAPSMAVGFTINHVAAVILPVVGGLLWVVDYRIPFVAAAVMSAVSLVAVQRITASVRSAALLRGASPCSSPP
jgi:predicted MFS family arabinose efflux permease